MYTVNKTQGLERIWSWDDDLNKFVFDCLLFSGYNVWFLLENRCVMVCVYILHVRILNQQIMFEEMFCFTYYHFDSL